jgi:hypothetical protein
VASCVRRRLGGQHPARRTALGPTLSAAGTYLIYTQLILNTSALADSTTLIQGACNEGGIPAQLWTEPINTQGAPTSVLTPSVTLSPVMILVSAGKPQPIAAACQDSEGSELPVPSGTFWIVPVTLTSGSAGAVRAAARWDATTAKASMARCAVRTVTERGRLR